MARNIYLNIDDDVSKVVARVKKEKSAELTLVVPKNSWLVSDPVNLKLLKKHTDLLGKYISIMTRDEVGQKNAAEVGFEVRQLDYLRKTGPGMDVLTKAKRPKYEPIPEPPAALSPAPAPAAQTEPQKTFLIEKSRLKLKTTAATGGHALRNSIIVAILVLVLIALVILPSATIVVYAHTEPLSRDLQISVDKNAQQVNTERLIIPGTLINQDLQYNMQFQATGKLDVGGKARGNIQIYNFTGKILKFKAATTILTAGSQTYHLVNDIAGIKPTRYFSGTKDPDPASLSAEVPVLADHAGVDSNLPAGTRLEITNQVLGNIPKLLYAKNDAPIDGGTSRFRTAVSQQDLDNAGKTLADKVLSSEKQSLLNRQKLMLIDSGSSFQLKNVTFDAAAGTQTEMFQGSGQAHLEALVFEANVLQNLVEQRINLTLDQNKYLVTGSKQTINEVYKSLDLTNGSGQLDVHFDSIVASKLDTAGIAAKIKGKNSSELKELLLSDPNIDGIDINFMPFWVRSVPAFSGRVKVQAKIKS